MIFFMLAIGYSSLCIFFVLAVIDCHCANTAVVNFFEYVSYGVSVRRAGLRCAAHHWRPMCFDIDGQVF